MRDMLNNNITQQETCKRLRSQKGREENAVDREGFVYGFSIDASVHV